MHIFGELVHIFGELVHIFAWKLVCRSSTHVSRNLGPLWQPRVYNDTKAWATRPFFWRLFLVEYACNFHREPKGRFRKRVVLANVPLFRSSFRGNMRTYHCHREHCRPEKILSELFPAILDRIITGKYSKRNNLIVTWAHYRNDLAVHRSHDTQTEIQWTKSCNELPDENSPTINSVIFDRNITGENSQRINLVVISVTIVPSFWFSFRRNIRPKPPFWKTTFLSSPEICPKWRPRKCQHRTQLLVRQGMATYSHARRQASSDMWAPLACLLLRGAWQSLAECLPTQATARPSYYRPPKNA